MFLKDFNLKLIKKYKNKYKMSLIKSEWFSKELKTTQHDT